MPSEATEESEGFSDPFIYGQAPYSVRFDWGLDGALASSTGVDAIVVVDTLSFTTAVSVAVERGALVYPYRWRDETASAFAAERGAELAGARGEARRSLSSLSLLDLGEGDRLVLPSPNGATICAAAGERGIRVIAGSLRCAAAVAAFIHEQRWSVAVIAAGEHWRGATGMRPCFEDLVGAGAILSGLDRTACSPEAQLAIGGFAAVAGDLDAALAACAGGRELAAWGYAEDVTMASALDASQYVPLLGPEGCFSRFG